MESDAPDTGSTPVGFPTGLVGVKNKIFQMTWRLEINSFRCPITLGKINNKRSHLAIAQNYDLNYCTLHNLLTWIS